MTTPQPTAEQIAAIRTELQQHICVSCGCDDEERARREGYNAGVDAALGKAAKALSALQQQMVEQQQALTAAQADVTIHLQRRQELEQQVAALTQENERLDDLLDARDTRITAAEQRLETVEQERDRQLTTIAELCCRHIDITGERDAAIRDKQAALHEQSKEILKLKTRAEAAEARLARLRELSATWREEAAIHAGANGDEAAIAYGRGVCADELGAVLAEGPAPAAKE